MEFVPSVAKDQLLIRENFSMMISGPSKSGKTVFVTNLVRNINKMCISAPEIIYWCYGEWQDSYLELKSLGVHLIEGLPDLGLFKQNKNIHKLLVIDDLMASTAKDTLTTLFTKGSHHWNLSICQLNQNLFYEGQRNARLNCQYLVLMKNPMDQSQVSMLARQLYPKKQNFLIEAYQDATSEPHGYLYMDLHQQTNEILRFRTKIFPGERTIVYIPK